MSRFMGADLPDDYLQKLIIRQADMLLRAGANYVIIDACNLHPHDYIRWETVALVCGAEMIWERLDTPPDVCAERLAARAEAKC